MHHALRSDSSCPRPSGHAWFTRSRLTALLAGLVAALLLVVWVLPEDADARRKRRRRVEPPLRIVSIAMTPETYIAGHGALDITIDVKLPPGTDGTTVLEVSSLISSPSKRHTRFLRNRQPIDVFLHPPPVADDAAGSADGAEAAPPAPTETSTPQAPPRRDRVVVTLSWDGTDQNQEVVSGGRYDYVIRAKLLAPDGEKLRTHMVSWKKKGSIRIQPPEAAPPQEPAAEGEGEAESPADEGADPAVDQDPAATPAPDAAAVPPTAPQAD